MSFVFVLLATRVGATGPVIDCPSCAVKAAQGIRPTYHIRAVMGGVVKLS